MSQTSLLCFQFCDKVNGGTRCGAAVGKEVVTEVKEVVTENR